jgi:hypothetical protein
VVELARAGKKFKEIQQTLQKAFGDKTLKKTAIYEILRRVKYSMVEVPRINEVSSPRRPKGLPPPLPPFLPPLKLTAVPRWKNCQQNMGSHMEL